MKKITPPKILAKKKLQVAIIHDMPAMWSAILFEVEFPFTLTRVQ
jgi:hypothetical protein